MYFFLSNKQYVTRNAFEESIFFSIDDILVYSQQTHS